MEINKKHFVALLIPMYVFITVTLPMSAFCEPAFDNTTFEMFKNVYINKNKLKAVGIGSAPLEMYGRPDAETAATMSATIMSLRNLGSAAHGMKTLLDLNETEGYGEARADIEARRLNVKAIKNYKLIRLYRNFVNKFITRETGNRQYTMKDFVTESDTIKSSGNLEFGKIKISSNIHINDFASEKNKTEVKIDKTEYALLDNSIEFPKAIKHESGLLNFMKESGIQRNIQYMSDGTCEVELAVEVDSNAQSPPELSIKTINLIDPSNDGVLDAEETGQIEVAIKNTGKGIGYDVILDINQTGQERSLGGINFNRRKFLGTIYPAEEKKLSVPIIADKTVKSADIALKVTAFESNGFDSKPLILAFRTREFLPPRLQVARIAIQDAEGGRIITKGKETTLSFDIQNAGQGKAEQVRAIIDIGDDDVKLYGDSEVMIGSLMPSESKKVTFNIAVAQRYSKAKELPITFTIREQRDEYATKPNFKLILGEEAPNINVVRIASREKTQLIDEATEDINVIPVLKKEQKVFNENDIAIVIGIERYQNLPKSEFSYNDAKLVRDYLKSLGFANRNVEFLTDEKATLSGIAKTIEKWLPNRVKIDSKVIIYYSGHGSPDPENGDAYLVPHDGDPNYLLSTGYALKRLYNEIGGLKVKEVIVVIDSCFSGAGGRSVLARGARPVMFKLNEPELAFQRIAVLSSTQGTQISTTLPDKGHGVFTYYFLKSLKEGNKDIVNIFKYLKPLVEDEAKKMNVTQSPVLKPSIDKLTGGFYLRK